MFGFLQRDRPNLGLVFLPGDEPPSPDGLERVRDAGVTIEQGGAGHGAWSRTLRHHSREHLWFKLHGIDGDELDATLVNRPFKADVRMNERAMRPLELLTDWVITTPAGQITPRSDVTSRRLREHADELREAMRKAKR